MPESLRMGVVVPGGNKDHKDRAKKPFVKPLKLTELISWIEKQNWDEYTKKELIKRASRYPCNGLAHFAQNINLQVIKIAEEKEKLRKMKNERESKNKEKIKGESQTDSVAIDSEKLL